MAVNKRRLSSGIKWYSRGQHLNVPYYSQAIFDTRGQALKWEREEQRRIEDRKINNSMSLKELLTARLDFLELNKNRHYYEDNKRHAKVILDEFGDISVSEITPKMANELILKQLRRCKVKKLTNHRANAFATNFRSFFNYGIKKMGLDMKNPCSGFEKFSVDHKIKFIPTDEMIKAVMDICTTEQKALIQFCYETACRISEALNFTVKDILKDSIVLYTRKSRHGNLVPRVLPKPELPKLPKKGRVFHQWDRRPDFLWAKIIKLGQPIWSWHSIRHFRTHKWALDGEPLVSIMAKLGHSSVETTMIYLRSLAINRF